MGRLGGRSFLVVLLMLAIAGLTPSVGSFVGLLIASTAVQMAAGRAVPFFPRWIAERPLPARHLRRIVPYAITALAFLEQQIHPRWPALIEATRLPTTVMIVLLSVPLTLMPIPLGNIGPALAIAMISLTALEEDELLLMVSVSAGLVLLTLNLAFVWDILRVECCRATRTVPQAIL
jgi:hypothetical protein